MTTVPKAAPSLKMTARMFAMQDALEMDSLPTSANGASGGLVLGVKLARPMPTPFANS